MIGDYAIYPTGIIVDVSVKLPKSISNFLYRDFVLSDGHPYIVHHLHRSYCLLRLVCKGILHVCTHFQVRSTHGMVT
jgi:hypothetical protein